MFGCPSNYELDGSQLGITYYFYIYLSLFVIVNCKYDNSTSFIKT